MDTEGDRADPHHPPYRHGAAVLLHAECVAVAERGDKIGEVVAALLAKRAYMRRRCWYAHSRVPLVARIIWWWWEEANRAR